MTVYILTVVKREDNPEYDAKRAAEWQERQARGGQYVYAGEAYTVTPTKDTRMLEVALDETEFDAVKHALIETWR